MGTLLLSLVFLIPSTSPQGLVGGDACALIEDLPSEKAPIRNHREYAVAFRALKRARGDVTRLGKARRLLEKRTRALLNKARKVFLERDAKVKKKSVRRFLDTHVYGHNPSLTVRDEGFALPVEVSATLAWLRCREGHRDAAIAYARNARHGSGSLLAFAALLLLDEGRRAEAVELVPQLGEAGFLAPYLRAEVAPEEQERLRNHRQAQLRMVRPNQQKALRAQKRRFPGLGEL